MDSVNHLLRRNRRRAIGSTSHSSSNLSRGIMDIVNNIAERDLDGPAAGDIKRQVRSVLDKRLTPAEIAQIQQEQQQQAAAAQASLAKGTQQGQQQAAQQTTKRVAAQPATKGTTINPQPNPASTAKGTTSYSFWNKYGATSSSTSTAKSTSSAKSTTSSTSSTTRSTATTKSSTSSTNTVLRVTQSLSSSASTPSTSLPINSAAADKNATSTSKMSTGEIAGIVAGTLVGLLILGSLAGWLYRKWAGRQFSVKQNWNKIDDDDVTPFPPNEKLINDHNDDIYGASAAPIIGSRRALAMARNNAFYPDGTMRPDSDYLAQDGNRAGYGAGHSVNQDPYGAAYGMSNPHGYPSRGARVPVPAHQMYSDQFESNSPHAISPPSNTRQLVGPAPVAQPYAQNLSPVALGRPSPPRTEAEFAHLQQFNDMPSSAGFDQRQPFTPTTAMSNGWGDEKPQRPSRPGDEFRRHSPPTQDIPIPDSPEGVLAPPPVPKDMETPRQLPRLPPQIAVPAATGLPAFEPMSPIRMSTFEMKRSSQPLDAYYEEDDSATQKRMYGEVADAAGLKEPPTPKMNDRLNESTATNATRSSMGDTTASSFSAHEPSRLPALNVDPPAPYVHGQPLSPLQEVETPRSGLSKMTDNTVTSSTRALPSATTIRAEENPFERTLAAARQVMPASSSARSLQPSFVDGPVFPSPAFPPPSPGGMSVPGSVTDSPRRWSGAGTSHIAHVERDSSVRDSRGVSMFYGEDAYGGI